MKGATRGLRGMNGGKFKGNYMRLMPGLCLDVRHPRLICGIQGLEC